jgi:hypothetical protein
LKKIIRIIGAVVIFVLIIFTTTLVIKRQYAIDKYYKYDFLSLNDKVYNTDIAWPYETGKIFDSVDTINDNYLSIQLSKNDIYKVSQVHISV